MESQEYTISYFKIGDFKDPNNNVWCEILFEEKSNEPMRIVVKDPSSYSVGQKLYGHVEVKTSKAGKPYNRFYRDKRPEYTVTTADPAKPNWGRDDKAIQAQMSIKAAIDIGMWPEFKDLEREVMPLIENRAKQIMAMIDRVKSGQPVKPDPTYTRESPGSYQEDKNDAEFESMIQSGMYAEGIDPEEYNA